MRKKRIGNDIAVQWSLVAKGTGEPFVVEGKDIRLSLKSIFATTEIEDFTARGNTIAWTFKGAEQKQTGIYSLVVSVVDAQGAMVTTDVCQFVELVACSCEADGADEAGVHTESIDLVSNVEIGGGMSITPDWSASEGEEGFIKNRTHYLDCDSYTPIDVESGEDYDTGYMRHTYRFVASPWSDETKVAVKVEIYNPTDGADDYIKYVILNTNDHISGEGDDIISFKVGSTEFYGMQDGDEITLWTLIGYSDEIPNLSFAYIYDRQYKQLDEVFISSDIARKSDVEKVDFYLGEVGAQVAGALQEVEKHEEQLTELSAEVSEKQDTITDLETIRSGAAKGATAIQEVKTINGQSIVGSGNIEIQGGGGGGMSTPSGDPMHYMFEAAGATYNATDADIPMVGIYGDSYVHKAKHWHLNELGDITNEEMRLIYLYANLDNGAKGVAKYLSGIEARTNIATWTSSWNGKIKDQEAFAYAYNVIVARMRNKEHYIDTNASYAFVGCTALQKILPTLDATATTSFNGVFDQCNNLREVRIKNAKVAIKFDKSPLISKASILYLIQNSAATSAMVITLHADAYARLAEDADIVAALAEKTNVSLASA